MTSAMVWPCAGPMTRVRRMSMSRVPGGISPTADFFIIVEALLHSNDYGREIYSTRMTTGKTGIVNFLSGTGSSPESIRRVYSGVHGTSISSFKVPALSSVRALYGTAVFGSAFLLFLIEPIAAKAILPALGGSSAVWITCLVFFQGMLVAGYLCITLAWRRVDCEGSGSNAIAIHLVLLALAVAVAIYCSWVFTPI